MGGPGSGRKKGSGGKSSLQKWKASVKEVDARKKKERADKSALRKIAKSKKTPSPRIGD